MSQLQEQFQNAVHYGGLDRIKELIEKHGYPHGSCTIDGESFMAYLLEFSVKYWHQKDEYLKLQNLLTFMLDKEANPSHEPAGHNKFRTAIYWAVYHGMYEVTELLLKRGVSARQTERETLCHAVLNLQDQMIELLIKYGADINVKIFPGNFSLIHVLESAYGKQSLSDYQKKQYDKIKMILTHGYQYYANFERQQLEQQKLERERLERERLERERLERERLERERLERERLERERLERERLERERLEQQEQDRKNKIRIASDHLGCAFADIKYLEDNKHHLNNNSKKKLIRSASSSILEAKTHMPKDVMNQIVNELPKEYKQLFDVMK